MNRTAVLVLLLACICLASVAQTPPSFTGRWIVLEDFFGTPRYMKLQLQQNGSKLTGELDGDKLEGTVKGIVIEFVARNEQKDSFEVRGTYTRGTLAATMVATDPAEPDLSVADRAGLY